MALTLDDLEEIKAWHGVARIAQMGGHSVEVGLLRILAIDRILTGITAREMAAPSAATVADALVDRIGHDGHIAFSGDELTRVRAHALHVAIDLEADREQLRVQLAGCGVAARGGTSDPQVAPRYSYGWSPAYQDVLDLRWKYEGLLIAQRKYEGLLHRRQWLDRFWAIVSLGTSLIVAAIWFLK